MHRDAITLTFSLLHTLCTYWWSIRGLLMCKLVCMCAHCLSCVCVVVFWWGRGESWVCLCFWCVGKGRSLPADRRGACCFLLGMLLQEFPLDFSCRSKKRPSWGGNRCNGRKSKQTAFPRLFGWLMKSVDLSQGWKKSLFFLIDASVGLINLYWSF